MKKNITIVGNGFASLFLIQYFIFMPVFPVLLFFFRRFIPKYEITLIGNGVFTYFPSIPEFILGTKSRKNVLIDIRPFLKRRNIHFINDMVTAIEDGGRKVITKNGVYKNDMLFLGIGPSFLEDDIAGTEEYTYSPCHGPDNMDRFMDKLNALDSGVIYIGYKINKQDGFVAGRAGQIYECACLLDYELKKRKTRDNFEIHFFSPNVEPGETGAITDRLSERGIILDYGYEPAEFVEGGLKDKDGSIRKADLVLYSPGITGAGWLQQSCISVSPGGHIDADKYGRVKGLDNVFSAGDCACHEDPPPWVPHQAHMAQLRSQAVARNMRDTLKGKAPVTTYRYELSCILNLENDAMWMHMSSDNKPPFWNIFPRRSKKLVAVKGVFEKLYIFYLRYL
ncbi:Sulfide:quinone oxidoreductase, Type VI [hydrothermal vent metagenome]|uniref:Sulfide:quinone oxidoreductase, Type VI n=1 Tax=hydrothermal vent metagenome TaxID=652676 RepID=A0A3B0XL56_9ZZZZ